MLFLSPLLKVAVLGGSAQPPLLSSHMPSTWVLSSLPVTTTYMLVAPQSISAAKPYLSERQAYVPNCQVDPDVTWALKVNTSKLNASSFSSTWASPVIGVLMNNITIHHDFQKPLTLDIKHHMVAILSYSLRILFNPCLEQHYHCSELCAQWKLLAIG